MRKWIADFETTSTEKLKQDGTTHVWACGVCEVGNPSNTIIFTTIGDFIQWCEKNPSNDTVFFHNLSFDGNFIVQYLLQIGFKFVDKDEMKTDRTFTTLISDKGLWYQVEVWFKVKGKKANKVTFRDSLKLIPLSVKQIGKSFKLPMQKGKIDYKAHDLLPEGSPLTDEEEDYLIKDIQIVEYALRFFHTQGMDKMTIGSCALDEFKKIITKKYFKRYFPPPFYDEDVRKAYKGGFTYLEPKYKNRMLGKMIVLDVNSLYPSVMRGCSGEILPYGVPIFFEGQYQADTLYNCYIQHIRCGFELKEGKIPTIQLKHTPGYQGNIYLTTSDGDIVDLYLTNVDLALFLENYEPHNLEYLNGWMFKGVKAEVIFADYVDKWSGIKVKSKDEGNHGMYLISKLMLNSLYGKFGTSTVMASKVPWIDKEGNLHFTQGKTEMRDGVYIAMACFITAYARNKTIRAAQMIKDNFNSGKSKIDFVYADTDSLHCISPNGELPEGLEIHPTKLGAWDHEATAVKGKFLRQKCYMERHIISEKDYTKAMADEDTIKSQYIKEGEQYFFDKITVAGMPESCYSHVSFSNFKIGSTYPGKLTHRTVFGGVVLEETEYTIKK